MIKINIVALACVLVLVGCGKEPEVRKYSEKKTTNKVNKSAQLSKGAIPIDQTTVVEPKFDFQPPEHWISEGGDAIAFASFSDSLHQSHCTFTILKGDGGGNLANIQRWLGQLGVQKSEEDVIAWVTNEEKNSKSLNENLNPLYLNFNKWIEKEDGNSLLTAIVNLDSFSLFVKNKGQKSSLAQAEMEFQNMLKSLKLVP